MNIDKDVQEWLHVCVCMEYDLDIYNSHKQLILCRYSGS